MKWFIELVKAEWAVGVWLVVGVVGCYFATMIALTCMHAQIEETNRMCIAKGAQHCVRWPP